MTRTAPVTVVIPAFNAAPFLAVTLESLQQQTTVPERVILVDDGSTDETLAIAGRFDVTCLHQLRAGPGSARNRGLREATSDYVAFLDSDDWYVPDKLERSIEHLEQLGAACVSTDAWCVRGDRIERRRNDRRVVPAAITLEQLLRGNPVVCSTVVARRRAVLDAGGFDESPELIATEDYDLWLRMAQREPIAYLPDPLTFYRTHAGSLSVNKRFLSGVDSILERIARAHEGEAHFQNLVLRRRSDARLDLAWDLMAEGRRAEAKALIAEAGRLSNSWKVWKMKLHTLLRR
ncbi:MAG TPA: glycosyltransferase family A protein [Planctomycetota bacterium]|nr:glycosyltransferase family A protein [Planctomycetota bacterium]